jgi:hypothetical protein
VIGTARQLAEQNKNRLMAEALSDANRQAGIYLKGNGLRRESKNGAIEYCSAEDLIGVALIQRRDRERNGKAIG